MRSAFMESKRIPRLILLHPQTWCDLVKEISNNGGMSINLYEQNMKYRGIKVIRCLDLLEDEFEFVTY